jgi:hypothetical protein
LFSALGESKRFVRSLAKVDFPDPFGPHIMIMGVFCEFSAGDLDKAWFHSGGDIIGCK